MENLINYITENALILIPALYILGTMAKNTNEIEDKYIPIFLLPIGIILSLFLVGFNIDGLIQGILVTGVSVYANQIVKQVNK